MPKAARVGAQAPDFTYTALNGDEARLSDLWAEGPALILWLRHFG